LLKNVYFATENARINNHVRFSLEMMLEVFPKAKNFIVLEDDLEISDDFLR